MSINNIKRLNEAAEKALLGKRLNLDDRKLLGNFALQASAMMQRLGDAHEVLNEACSKMGGIIDDFTHRLA